MERTASRTIDDRDLGAGAQLLGSVGRKLGCLLGQVGRRLGRARQAGRRQPAAAVRLDLHEDGQAYEILAELPGVDAQDIELQLADNILIITGEKQRSWCAEGGGRLLVERSHGRFRRRVAIPGEIEADKVEARFAKGVLTVTLPKSPAQAARTRKIEIQAG